MTRVERKEALRLSDPELYEKKYNNEPSTDPKKVAKRERRNKRKAKEALREKIWVDTQREKTKDCHSLKEWNKLGYRVIYGSKSLIRDEYDKAVFYPYQVKIKGLEWKKN
jgi:hypothetical protein